MSAAVDSRSDLNATEQDAEDFYADIEIEDMQFNEEHDTYYYPCPCGDKFFITKVTFLQVVWWVVAEFGVCALLLVLLLWGNVVFTVWGVGRRGRRDDLGDVLEECRLPFVCLAS